MPINHLDTIPAEGAATCDVLVYGSTPGGLACALRAAREGLTVILITPTRHLGGLLSSGLSTMDTLYHGPRAPIYDELRHAIHAYYREQFGEDSEAYRASQPGFAKTKFEAHVVEGIFERMVTAEASLQIVRTFEVAAVNRGGRSIRSIDCRSLTDGRQLSVTARCFADCSYEADLAALAGVSCRVGRESRVDFGEEHAGRIFMRRTAWPPPEVDPAIIARHRRLNLVHYDRWYEIVESASSGAADPAVQAYNLRTVLTNDPDNRIQVERPADYDRERLLSRLGDSINWSVRVPGTKLPNRKTYWNLPELIGPQNDYVDGDRTTRAAVIDEHVSVTLQLLYFLQHDNSIDPEVRAAWKQWGLCRDEFADHGHMPYEIYVRETRRIVGREVFTENDARWAKGVDRAPVHADAIGVTEWFLDSHACTAEKVEGSLWEGELLLSHLTVPGQISWRTLLPEDVDNLLVPVCLSASHIGWGAVRLEPTWMALGESAAWAAVLARQQSREPADIDVDLLQRQLAEQRIMLSFFNDVDQHVAEDWYPAVQYLGTQGYFGSYDVKPDNYLSQPLAEAWAAHYHALRDGAIGDVTADASRIWQAEQQADETRVTAAGFARLLGDSAAQQSEALLTRAEACYMLYRKSGPVTPCHIASSTAPRTCP